MKKLFALICTLVLLAACAGASALTVEEIEAMLNGGSSAATVQEDTRILYEMPKLKASMKVPENYLVIDENTSEDDFAFLGVSKADMVAFMQENDTYALLYPGTYDYEIDIVMAANTISSFDGFSDADLSKVAEMLVDMFAEMGCTVEKSEVYTGPANKYIRTWYSIASDTGTTYVMQYYIVENNMGIIYRMFSYTGSPITQQMQDELKQLIDSAVYD